MAVELLVVFREKTRHILAKLKILRLELQQKCLKNVAQVDFAKDVVDLKLTMLAVAADSFQPRLSSYSGPVVFISCSVFFLLVRVPTLAAFHIPCMLITNVTPLLV